MVRCVLEVHSCMYWMVRCVLNGQVCFGGLGYVHIEPIQLVPASCCQPVFMLGPASCCPANCCPTVRDKHGAFQEEEKNIAVVDFTE